MAFTCGNVSASRSALALVRSPLALRTPIPWKGLISALPWRKPQSNSDEMRIIFSLFVLIDRPDDSIVKLDAWAIRFIILV